MIWEDVFQPLKQREEQGQRPRREGKLCGPSTHGLVATEVEIQGQSLLSASFILVK